MSVPFSSETAQSLANQIDAQLAALTAERSATGSTMAVQRSLDPNAESPIAKQAAEIERITHEPAASFMNKVS